MIDGVSFTTEDYNFSLSLIVATAPSVGEVAVSAAPAAVSLASAKTAAAAAALAKTAPHIFCAGNPSRLLGHIRRCR